MTARDLIELLKDVPDADVVMCGDLRQVDYVEIVTASPDAAHSDGYPFVLLHPEHP